MNLGELLPMTLAGTVPTAPTQVLGNGVCLRWLAEGVVRVDPPAAHEGRLLLSAGVHGNETAPIEWLDRLLRSIAAGRWAPKVPLLLIFGNPSAIRAGTRYVEHDMNRLFNRPLSLTPGFEADRAAHLEQLAADFFDGARQRLHYDLHTALRGSRFERFALYPWQPGRRLPAAEQRRLAAAGMQAVLLHDGPGHTFSAFTFEALGAESFTLELGKARPFGENEGLDLNALDGAIRALADGHEPAPPAVPLLRYRVADRVVKRSAAFVLHVAAQVENFTPLPLGLVLAQDGAEQWRVEQPNACIVFPNPDVAIGQRAGLIVVQEVST